MPRQRPLAQLRLLLRTTSLTSPGSASLLLAPRCLPPALLPPASARLPAHCAHPTPPAQPSTSGRECGSAGKTPDGSPVAALLLSPASLPPHAATPPFHTDYRNPARSISPHGSCAEPWPSSHTGRLLPTPQANENPLEVYPQRQASCQRDRLLHEHKRLFVGSPLQQAIREAERTVDLYPDVLNLFRQRQRHVTTAQAVMHLPIMHLRLRQQPPAHGFRCPIRQRLGGRCTQDKGWHAQLSRRAWLASQLRI